MGDTPYGLQVSWRADGPAGAAVSGRQVVLEVGNPPPKYEYGTFMRKAALFWAKRPPALADECGVFNMAETTEKLGCSCPS